MRRGLTALFVTVGLVVVCAADAAAWWSNSWSHRRKLTFDNSTQPPTFDDFPVLVVLNGGRVDYSKTRDDGSDLRFVDADDLTLLDHEIEKWDESGNSYVWVRVPQVTGASNTDFIWMYYGNAAAAALPLANQRATWTGTYVMVHHFDEAAGAHLDSTSNGNDSSVIDVQAQASPTGKIDGADVFDGLSAHNVDVPDSPTLDMGANDSFTVEAWVKTTNAGDQMVVSKEDGVSEYQLWTSGGVATFWLNDGAVTARVSASGPTVDDGAWHYLVGRWSDGSGGVEIFVDGVGQGADVQPALDAMSSATPLVIGEEGDANRGFNFDGTIDEVRVRKSSLSTDDWIYAQFLTQSDTGAGLVGPFVTYGPEAAHCCDLAVTETSTEIFVAGPNRFDMRFNRATGGGIDRFVDAEENTGVDLAGGADGTSSQPTLFADEFQTGSGVYLTSADPGGYLDLLEATPARVRIRAKSFYQLVGAATVLPGVQGVGTYSLYSIGRMGLDWRRVSTSPVAYNALELNTTVHWQPTGSLNGWAAYGQSGALAQGGGEDFVLLRNEQPGARTDILHVLSQDWAGADVTGTYQIDGAGAQEWKEATWQDSTPGTLSADQAFRMLYYFKPTTLGTGASPWLDSAVTSRSTDYRGPSTTVVGPGAGWVDGAENTATDPLNVFFNEAEAAYVFDLDPATGLTFDMDGSGTTRYSPFFKIRRWRSFVEAPVVTLEGSPLLVGLDYRAALKPLSRAHRANSLAWHHTGQSAAAPVDVGTGGGVVVGNGVIVPGRYGNGLSVATVSNDSYYFAPPADFSFGVGAIDFWYQPYYDSTTAGPRMIWHNSGGAGSDRDCFWLEHTGGNLVLRAYLSADDLNCNTGGSTLFTVTATGASYSWRAFDWVHVRAEWNSSSYMRLVVDGRIVASTGSYSTVGWDLDQTRIGSCQITCPGGGAPRNADGVIDEPHIYVGMGSSGNPETLAYAGLVADGREALGNPASNVVPLNSSVGAGNKGQYLYLGADSRFRGFNMSFVTPGSGVAAGALVWQYWRVGGGFEGWADLEGVTDFLDGTVDFSKTGTVKWDADPADWTPYSVNGGPDLYYVRVYLSGGVSYSTPPVERVIKTDILLFQYCGDIAAAAQTFVFGVPATTAVELMSFGAVPGDGSVTLEWSTGSEVDNLGFHLYRGPSADGPWTRLTSSLIPGLGSSPLGQAYSWFDSGLTNGTRYYYRLEDVDTASASTFHGPVSATPEAAVSPPPGGGGGGGEPGGGPGGEPGNPPNASCPSWVLAAAPEAVSPVCTRHGDPDAVSLQILARGSSSATVELRTGGFWVLQGAAGEVRVFVPGLEFPTDPKAPALPLRRALVPAVIGKQVHLVSAQAFELQSFPGLRPSAVGGVEMSVSRDGTVRPTRRSVPARFLSRGYLPREVARLAGTAFQGERKSAVVEMTPVRFSGSRNELVLASRVRVKLRFAGVAAGEVPTGGGGRVLPRKGQLREVLAQLFTTRRGLHAVRYEELFPTDRRGVSTTLLRLQRQGEAVPFQVRPAGPVFGPGSVLYFYADREVTSTEYSSEVAYELVRGAGVRMGVTSAPPSGASLSSSTGFASFETNRVYQPGLLEAPDIWLWDGIASGVARAKGFTLSGVDTSSSPPARLVVYLQGGSESGITTDHHVSLSVNGGFVGEVTFSGKRPHPLEVPVPVSLLREGANELSVANVGDTGVYSLVFLDRFELSYPQASTTQHGVFEGVWAESGTVEVSGLSGPPVILRALVILGDSVLPGPEGSATADPSSPATSGAPRDDSVRWLSGFQMTPGSVRFQAEAGYRYTVVSPEGLLKPRVGRVPPSTLKAGTNQADYLVIAPREFLEAALPLVERRRGQGLVSRAVSFEEIASEFGHGRPSAEAIRAFLKHAYHSWQRPSPRYVVLLGDATYDPQHFQATSWASPLPALWTKTSYLWTASDPALGAVNGEDLLPDLAIGRLPATTREQAEALVSKLLAWEDSGQGLGGNAVLVADTPDAAGDFEGDVEDIHRSFLLDRSTATLKVREMGAATRPGILGALDEGASMMSYVGHGGTAVWSSSNVLNSWDTPSLRAQSRQPLLLTLNCLNGYFVAPNFDSLSESLVKVEGRGAIAAVSPTGLSLDGPAHQYHRALMAEITSGRHARLGDAILAAQAAYAQTGLMPELLTVYQLLGDPATRIRPAP